MSKKFRVIVVGNLDETYEVEAEHHVDAEKEAVRKFYDEHSGYWSAVEVADIEEVEDDDGRTPYCPS